MVIGKKRPFTGAEYLESLRDGMLLEGYAAVIASARADRASDGRVVETLRVIAADEASHAALSADVLEWCFANGRRLTAEEILIYNSFMSKRGWHDDESDGFIPEMIKHYGLPDNGTVLTDFDLIEMDEGRWYPEMWRDAWK